MSVFFVFIAGLFIGSFLNVLIERFPRNEKITGRSYCEFCKAQLKWYDLIPVLSFVYLQGKCRYCHASLSYQYPLIEILTGLMFGLVYFFVTTGQIFNLFYSLFIVSVMIVIFFTDLKYGIIPDKILVPAIIVSLVFLLTELLYSKLVYYTLIGHPFFNHLLAGFGAFLFMLFLYLITKGKGMGFGDVKFSFLMGMVLGFPGVFYSMYLAFLTGGAFAIILILWKKKKLKSQIPFGPFLVANFLITLLFQPQLNRLFSALLN